LTGGPATAPFVVPDQDYMKIAKFPTILVSFRHWLLIKNVTFRTFEGKMDEIDGFCADHVRLSFKV